jgi:hypothetical protein
MPRPPLTRANEVEGDFPAFTEMLDRVVSVPRERIEERLAAEKKQKRTRAATRVSASARASRAHD